MSNAYANSCRMCLLELEDGVNVMNVTKNVEKMFYKLIRVRLKTSQKHSSFVCIDCYETLEKLYDFYYMMIENQAKLNEVHGDQQDLTTKDEGAPSSDSKIKLEEPMWIKEEFLDFDTYVTQYVSEDTMISETVTENDPVSNRKGGHLRDKCSEDGAFDTENSIEVIEEMIVEDHEEIPEDHRLCSICAEVVHRLKFNAHIRKHKLEINQKVYECDNCDYKISSKNLMSKHAETHFGVRRQHKCSFCPKTYLVATSRLNHEKKVHLKLVEKHDCACGKSYPTKSGLYNHTQKVHTSGFFPCPKCEKSFTCKIDLNLHNIRFHKPKIACEVCGLLKAPGLIYSTHMKTHFAGEFKCGFENCDKKFNYKYSRDYHFESEHGSPEGFNCPTCNAVFKMKRQLNRHIKRQHESNTMTCEVPGCSYTFKRKEYIVRHIKNHRDIDDKVKCNMLEELKTKFKFS